MKKKIIVILAIVALMPNMVLAHPGNTDKFGCHKCRTNCEKWGLNYGEYHCHNGGTSSSNGSSNNNSFTQSKEPVIPIVKSNNANLKSLKIDENNISIESIMNFTTTSSFPTIVAVPSHSKATAIVDKPSIFIHGINEVNIKVIAEDGTKKDYKLYVNVINDDATLKKISIGNDELEIQDEMEYKTTNAKITLTPIATSEYTEIEYEKSYNLNLGENQITIKVKAETGLEKEYIIKVTREKILSTNNNATIYVNGIKAEFTNYKSQKMNLSSKITTLDIQYELEEKTSTIELEYDKTLEVGDRIVKFTVTSENGNEQEYILNIHKNSQSEEIMKGIISIGILSGLGYGLYKLIKKGKVLIQKNQKNK